LQKIKMNKPIIILGAGSIGKSAMEAFQSNDVLVYGFLDDDSSIQGKDIGEVEVMGKLDDQTYLSVIGSECEAFVAMEEIEVRRNLVQMLMAEHKVMPVNAIHDSATLATSTVIGHGNYIGAGVIIGSYTELKNHLIINPGAIINHDVKLGDYVQIGAGTTINSGVQIEDEVFVGSGVTIVGGIKVGHGARIGAGSVVIKNVDAGETVFGNPAEPV
jgi:sugar O-acyltransferase (sialic acid O-acetyltransferase NeuD family)